MWGGICDQAPESEVAGLEANRSPRCGTLRIDPGGRVVRGDRLASAGWSGRRAGSWTSSGSARQLQSGSSSSHAQRQVTLQSRRQLSTSTGGCVRQEGARARAL